MGPRALRVRCYAKINLGLWVLGRRPDGYHEIRTVLQTIDLHDTLEVTRDDRFRLEVIPEEAGLPATEAPTGDDNLVLQAARAFSERFGGGEALFRLYKRIPAQAGLGGGSSDAASALMALERLHGERIGAWEIHSLAASLGADVPFFLYGGACLALGRGDEIYPLPEAAPMHLVVCVPEAGNATRAVYEAWDRSLTSSDKMCTINRLAPWSLVLRGESPDVGNDLEEAAIGLRPSLRGTRATLEACGARSVAMTGSGSAFFGLCPSQEDAAAVARLAREAGCNAVAARCLRRDERDRTLWSSGPARGV